jgi:hypothetical protein
MKTAMQELIEHIDIEMKQKGIIPNWDMYLEKEKEQITKAWDDGDYAYFYSKETGRDFDNGEDYFNEKYKK